MNFFRLQEERLAIRLLTREYEKKNLPLPQVQEIARQAAAVVDDAHRIARQGGKNVFSILKDMVRDLKKG